MVGDNSRSFEERLVGKIAAEFLSSQFGDDRAWNERAAHTYLRNHPRQGTFDGNRTERFTIVFAPTGITDNCEEKSGGTNPAIALRKRAFKVASASMNS